MIGYYVHHHGDGHLHRATIVSGLLGESVTGLSSHARPADWYGSWVQLPRDDEGIDPLDVDANGRLHWVPEHDDGLRARTSEISEWIAAVDPDLMVVDVSVEIALLARLHGVPVVTLVLPGDRRDPAHQLVHQIARRVVAPWPESVRGMLRGVDEGADSSLLRVGAISRFDNRIGTAATASPAAEPRVALLMGAGGSDLTAAMLDAAREQTPGWHWDVLDKTLGTWTDDPWAVLSAADVVITHAGQNVLAEVAAARKPAVVVPQTGPHVEQDICAAALGLGQHWPVVVVDALPTSGWAELLGAAREMDGNLWSEWNDGHGAERLAAAIEHEVGRRGG